MFIFLKSRSVVLRPNRDHFAYMKHDHSCKRLQNLDECSVPTVRPYMAEILPIRVKHYPINQSTNQLISNFGH